MDEIMMNGYMNHNGSKINNGSKTNAINAIMNLKIKNQGDCKYHRLRTNGLGRTK